MKLQDFLTEYGAMVQLDKLWSKPVGSQQHLLKKSKKKKKTETKEAPKGTYFTKSGNLVRGRLTKAAKERGARETDPKDKSRSKVPPVTQTRESDFDYASGKPKPDKNTTWKKFLIYKYKFSKDTFLSINKMEDIIRRKSRKDYDALMRLKNQFFAGDQDLKTEGKRIPRKKGQPAGSKKHSDLYTDENPKGTIHGLKFATVKDAQASVSKIRSSGKKHAHKIQAAVAMEQRAKAAGKKSAAAVYRKFINQMKKKTKKMKKENAISKGVEEGTRCWKGYKKKGMKTMFGKRVPNCVKNEDIEAFENLRDWFGKGKKGGAGGGGWDRYNTKGERIGKCGDSKKGEGKPKCLSKSKAASLRAKGGKAAIGAAVRKKRRNDPNKNRKGKAKNVSNTTRKSKK